MDGGAYAPIVSRILKSGRWVGSDGRKVAQEWLEMKVSICGERFPAGSQKGCGRYEEESLALIPIIRCALVSTP